MAKGKLKGERKLTNRRRRASKGKAIRVSNLVYESLDRTRRNQSWDGMFRRMVGLPDRSGRTQPLVEGMLEVITGMFVLKLNDATWAEVTETTCKLAEFAARRKKLRTELPIRMREIR